MSESAVNLERLRIELEKRQHFRIPTSIAATWRTVDGTESGELRIVNLGLGGARADFPVEPRLAADIIVVLPAQQGTILQSAVEIPASVCWTVANRTTGPFPSGLQFPALDQKLKRRLFEYIAVQMD